MFSLKTFITLLTAFCLSTHCLSSINYNAMITFPSDTSIQSEAFFLSRVCVVGWRRKFKVLIKQNPHHAFSSDKIKFWLPLIILRYIASQQRFRLWCQAGRFVDDPDINYATRSSLAKLFYWLRLKAFAAKRGDFHATVKRQLLIFIIR